jgi:hypothetical protein
VPPASVQLRTEDDQMLDAREPEPDLDLLLSPEDEAEFVAASE